MQIKMGNLVVINKSLIVKGSLDIKVTKNLRKSKSFDEQGYKK